MKFKCNLMKNESNDNVMNKTIIKKLKLKKFFFFLFINLAIK